MSKPRHGEKAAFTVDSDDEVENAAPAGAAVRRIPSLTPAAMARAAATAKPPSLFPSGSLSSIDLTVAVLKEQRVDATMMLRKHSDGAAAYHARFEALKPSGANKWNKLVMFFREPPHVPDTWALVKSVVAPTQSHEDEVSLVVTWKEGKQTTRDARVVINKVSAKSAEWLSYCADVRAFFQEGVAAAKQEKRGSKLDGVGDAADRDSSHAGIKRARDSFTTLGHRMNDSLPAMKHTAAAPSTFKGAIVINTQPSRPQQQSYLHDFVYKPRSPPVVSPGPSAPEGFANIGNTCFMNSVLNALLHMSSFSRAFLDPFVTAALQWADEPPEARVSTVIRLLACSAESVPRLQAAAAAMWDGATPIAPSTARITELMRIVNDAARGAEVIDVTGDEAVDPVAAVTATIPGWKAPMMYTVQFMLQGLLQPHVLSQVRLALQCSNATAQPLSDLTVSVLSAPVAVREALAELCLMSPATTTPTRNGGVPLINALRPLLLRKLDGNSVTEQNLRSFKEAIAKYNDDYDGYRQQDAHEFFEQMVDSLFGEVDAVNSLLCVASGRMPLSAPPSVDVGRGVALDAAAVQAARSRRVHQQYLLDATSVFARTFCMRMRRTITCAGCGYKRSTIELFRDMSVALPTEEQAPAAAPPDDMDVEPSTRGVTPAASAAAVAGPSTSPLPAMPSAFAARESNVYIAISDDEDGDAASQPSETHGATRKRLQKLNASPAKSPLSTSAARPPSPPPSPSPEAHEFSLDELLHLFFAPVELEYKCEKCDCKKASGANTIESLPRVLVVHVKRFEWKQRRQAYVKRLDEVSFPLELSLDDFCETNVALPPPVDIHVPSRLDEHILRRKLLLQRKTQERESVAQPCAPPAQLWSRHTTAAPLHTKTDAGRTSDFEWNAVQEDAPNVKPVQRAQAPVGHRKPSNDPGITAVPPSTTAFFSQLLMDDRGAPSAPAVSEWLGRDRTQVGGQLALGRTAAPSPTVSRIRDSLGISEGRRAVNAGVNRSGAIGNLGPGLRGGGKDSLQEIHNSFQRSAMSTSPAASKMLADDKTRAFQDIPEDEALKEALARSRDASISEPASASRKRARVHQLEVVDLVGADTLPIPSAPPPFDSSAGMAELAAPPPTFNSTFTTPHDYATAQDEYQQAAAADTQPLTEPVADTAAPAASSPAASAATHQKDVVNLLDDDDMEVQEGPDAALGRAAAARGTRALEELLQLQEVPDMSDPQTGRDMELIPRGRVVRVQPKRTADTSSRSSAAAATPALQPRYHLSAIVNHHGLQAHYGHYTTMVRDAFSTDGGQTAAFEAAVAAATVSNTPDPVEAALRDDLRKRHATSSGRAAKPPSDTWFHYNDEYVTKMSTAEVTVPKVYKSSYLLFYTLGE